MQMNESDHISDERIRAAMAEGKFDNLPGMGKPLNLDENPYEPEDMRMANSVLRSNDFTPVWIEIWKEIEQDLEKARRRYETGAALDAEMARTEFSTAIAALNRRILDYNLRVPSNVFQRPTLLLQKEIDTIQSKT
jgi:DnaJ homolog subfamily C member 28